MFTPYRTAVSASGNDQLRTTELFCNDIHHGTDFAVMVAHLKTNLVLCNAGIVCPGISIDGMKTSIPCLTAVLAVLATQFCSAAEVVKPDVVLRLDRVQPSHRLVETSRLQLPYGLADDAIGFQPAGSERQAVGPHAFQIDAQGAWLIADPVKRRTVKVTIVEDVPVLTRAEALPQTPSAETGVQVRKCNAEAGLLTIQPDGRQIQLETGGPLASIRVIGVNPVGDIYLVIEKFRKSRTISVDREVLVIDPAGALKARLPIQDKPVIHPDRDLRLGPAGALHRMVSGSDGLTLVRWEVRP